MVLMPAALMIDLIEMMGLAWGWCCCGIVLVESNVCSLTPDGIQVHGSTIEGQERLCLIRLSRQPRGMSTAVEVECFLTWK